MNVAVVRPVGFQTSEFLLRHGYRYRDGSAWRTRHWQWIRSITMPEHYEQIVLTESIAAVMQRQLELKRFDDLVAEAAKQAEYAPIVAQLTALRGIDTLSAMTIVAELGDLRRFPSARHMMAAVGLVPSEYSTGDKTRRFSITKTGNAHVRHVAVQAAWQYQHAPRSGTRLQKRRSEQTPEVLTIARTADHRLHRKYVRLTSRGKRSTVAATAIARELIGFIWAIGVTVETEQRKSRAIAA